MALSEQPQNRNLPTFNRHDQDKMALGHNPSTRSAELVAGARAFLMNTHETVSLSRMSGRIVARFLTDLDGKINILWFFPARMIVIEALTKRFIPQDKPDLLLVDVAAGFSPRGLHLAQEYPLAEVIEIDLPEMIEEKKNRLVRGKIEIPPNLKWLSADLATATLADVLEGRKADLITSEGLTLYLTPDENARLCKQIAACLAPGGVFMEEIYLRDKFLTLRQSPNVNSVASFILRMVGGVPGIMPKVDTAKKYLSDAGFTGITEYPVTEMMKELEQTPPVDVISIMVAHQPAAPEASPKTAVENRGSWSAEADETTDVVNKVETSTESGEFAKTEVKTEEQQAE